MPEGWSGPHFVESGHPYAGKPFYTRPDGKSTWDLPPEPTELPSFTLLGRTAKKSPPGGPSVGRAVVPGPNVVPPFKAAPKSLGLQPRLATQDQRDPVVTRASTPLASPPKVRALALPAAPAPAKPKAPSLPAKPKAPSLPADADNSSKFGNVSSAVPLCPPPSVRNADPKVVNKSAVNQPKPTPPVFSSQSGATLGRSPSGLVPLTRVPAIESASASSGSFASASSGRLRPPTADYSRCERCQEETLSLIHI